MQPTIRTRLFKRAKVDSPLSKASFYEPAEVSPTAKLVASLHKSIARDRANMGDWLVHDSWIPGQLGVVEELPWQATEESDDMDDEVIEMDIKSPIAHHPNHHLSFSTGYSSNNSPSSFKSRFSGYSYGNTPPLSPTYESLMKMSKSPSPSPNHFSPNFPSNQFASVSCGMRVRKPRPAPLMLESLENSWEANLGEGENWKDHLVVFSPYGSSAGSTEDVSSQSESSGNGNAEPAICREVTLRRYSWGRHHFSVSYSSPSPSPEVQVAVQETTRVGSVSPIYPTL